MISADTQLIGTSRGWVRVGGTLGAKDGAVELTRTYARRVPAGRTRPQLKISANHLMR